MTNLEGRNLPQGWGSGLVRESVVPAYWMAEKLAGLPGSLPSLQFLASGWLGSGSKPGVYGVCVERPTEKWSPAWACRVTEGRCMWWGRALADVLFPSCREAPSSYNAFFHSLLRQLSMMLTVKEKCWRDSVHCCKADIEGWIWAERQ